MIQQDRHYRNRGLVCVRLFQQGEFWVVWEEITEVFREFRHYDDALEAYRDAVAAVSSGEYD